MDIGKIDLSDAGFKKAFLEGKLAIDCLQIKLIQNGTDTPRTFSCAGYLLVNPDVGAEARLVIKREDENAFDPFEELKEAFKVAPGELIPDNFYYRLEATDISGNVWTCPSLSVKFNNRVTATILTFECAEIEVEITGGGSTDFANFVFLEDLKLPKNKARSSNTIVRGRELHHIKKEVSVGEVGGMQLSYHHCDTDLAEAAYELVAIAPEGSTLAHWAEMRLIEAIRFGTATRAVPVMTEVSRSGKRVVRLSKRSPVKGGGLVQPPLADERESSSFYHLLDCFYRFALADAKEDEPTTLSVRLENLFTLKDVWLSTVVLLVCVSAEGVLDDPLFKTLGAPPAEELEAVNKMFEAVATAQVDAGLINRARSAMGSMKSGRPKDKMYALAAVGAVTEAEIKAWGALRNTAAHGGVEIKENKVQQCLDQIHLVLTMIYKLAFLKIGYVGLFSDYGAENWVATSYNAPALLAALQAPPEEKAIEA